MATTYTTNYNLGKQENHADKFDMDVITDNADKIDAALTELQRGIDGKQATLTTAQLAAVNSGITSTDVEQIQTNKNNILSLTANIQPTSYNAVEVETGAPITILGGGYVRIGTLICINLKISITGAISQADTLIKGLPKPILEYNTGFGAVSLTNNLGRVFNVIGVGSLAYGDATSISSGTVILSGMYIAQS